MKINYGELVDYNKEIVVSKDIEEMIEYEDILLQISKTIIDYRKEKELTQKEFADLIGVKQEMISKLERGTYNPTFKQIYKISRKIDNTSKLFIDVLKNIIYELE